LQESWEAHVPVEGRQTGAAVVARARAGGGTQKNGRQSLEKEEVAQASGGGSEYRSERAVHWGIMEGLDIGGEAGSCAEGATQQGSTAAEPATAAEEVVHSRHVSGLKTSRGCEGVEVDGQDMEERPREGRGNTRGNGVWQVKTPEPGVRALQQDPQQLKMQLLKSTATSKTVLGESPACTAQAVGSSHNLGPACLLEGQRGSSGLSASKAQESSSSCSSGVVRGGIGACGSGGGGGSSALGQQGQQKGAQGPQRLNMWQKKLLRKGMGRIWLEGQEGQEAQGHARQESYQQPQLHKQRPYTAGVARQYSYQQQGQGEEQVGFASSDARSCQEVQWRTIEHSGRARAGLEVHGSSQFGGNLGRVVISAGRLARSEIAAGSEAVKRCSHRMGGGAVHAKQGEQQQQHGAGGYRAARASVDEGMVRRCMAMQQHGFEAWSTGAPE
jgi:hypothetical protein